ncbi:hypothetical protein JW826_02165 [Candidatus Woesearchaeota archaeon]|nr:hypothetical protein [Candidatus Woesearchaeota archaeon]
MNNLFNTQLRHLRREAYEDKLLEPEKIRKFKEVYSALSDKTMHYENRLKEANRQIRKMRLEGNLDEREADYASTIMRGAAQFMDEQREKRGGQAISQRQLDDIVTSATGKRKSLARRAMQAVAGLSAAAMLYVAAFAPRPAAAEETKAEARAETASERHISVCNTLPPQDLRVTLNGKVLETYNNVPPNYRINMPEGAQLELLAREADGFDANGHGSYCDMDMSNSKEDENGVRRRRKNPKPVKDKKDYIYERTIPTVLGQSDVYVITEKTKRHQKNAKGTRSYRIKINVIPTEQWGKDGKTTQAVAGQQPSATSQTTTTKYSWPSQGSAGARQAPSGAGEQPKPKKQEGPSQVVYELKLLAGVGSRTYAMRTFDPTRSTTTTIAQLKAMGNNTQFAIGARYEIEREQEVRGNATERPYVSQTVAVLEHTFRPSNVPAGLVVQAQGMHSTGGTEDERIGSYTDSFQAQEGSIWMGTISGGARIGKSYSGTYLQGVIGGHVGTDDTQVPIRHGRSVTTGSDSMKGWQWQVRGAVRDYVEAQYTWSKSDISEGVADKVSTSLRITGSLPLRVFAGHRTDSNGGRKISILDHVALTAQYEKHTVEVTDKLPDRSQIPVNPLLEMDGSSVTFGATIRF